MIHPLLKPFLQLFIVVNIKECSRWILGHVNTNESHIVIYNSMKLKYDKYQLYLLDPVRMNFKSIHVTFESLFSNAFTSFTSTAIPFRSRHLPHVHTQWARVGARYKNSRSQKIKRCRCRGRPMVVEYSSSNFLRIPIYRIVQNNVKAYRKKIGPTVLEFYKGNRWEGCEWLRLHFLMMQIYCIF